MFSQIKDRKHTEHNFHSVARVMPRGWDLWVLGGGGVKNFSVGICDGAPSTALSSFRIAFDAYFKSGQFIFVLFIFNFFLFIVIF